MRLIKKGTTDVSVELFIVKDTDGTPKTDVVASGIVPFYRRGISATQANLAPSDLAAVDSTHTDWGIKHVSDGSYRLDLPDAAFESGVDVVHIGATVTNGIALPITIQLVAFDPQDTVRLGQTALPNAAADAAGGLPVSDAGGLDLDGLNTTVGTINTTTGTINTTTGTINTTTNTINTNLTTVDGIVDNILLDTNSLNSTKIPDTISLANINAQVDSAIETYNLDHLMSAAAANTDVADNSVIAKLVSSSSTADWDDFANTTDSLQAIRDRGDASWVTGSTGLTPASIRAEIDANSTKLADILEDTGTTIPAQITGLNDFDPATDTVVNVTNCANNADMRGTDNAALATAVTGIATNVTSILEDTATTIPATITTLQTTANNIRTDTNVDLPATLSTIDSVVDNILIDTGTTLPASIASIPTSQVSAAAIRTEIDSNSTKLASILEDTGTTIPAQITGLNDFDPASDTVASVTTVGTCTTNTDMRGTDSAATAASLTTMQGNVTSILEDTETTIPATLTTLTSNLQTVDDNVDLVLEDTGTTIPATLSTIDGIVDSILEDTGTTLPATLTTIDGIVDEIKEDTQTTIPATLTTIDTVVDSILEDTGTTLPGTLASILEDTGTTLPGTLSTISGSIGTVDTVVDSILEDTGTTLPATLATIDGVVDSILEDTGTTLPATLSTIDGVVDDILDDTSTTIPSTLATIDTVVDSILEDTGTTIPGTITTLTSNVGTVDTVVDSILADTNEIQQDLADGGRLDVILDAIYGQLLNAVAEPGQGAPASTATRGQKIDYLYKWARNKTTQTSTHRNHYDDTGNTIDHKASVSDDGSTFTRGEIETGA